MSYKFTTCNKNHKYLNDLPLCPVCNPGFYNEFGTLAKPAQRALYNAGILTLKQLSTKSKNEVLEWHGMGKSSIPKLEDALSAKGLSFKK